MCEFVSSCTDGVGWENLPGRHISLILVRREGVACYVSGNEAAIAVATGRYVARTCAGPTPRVSQEMVRRGLIVERTMEGRILWQL